MDRRRARRKMAPRDPINYFNPTMDAAARDTAETVLRGEKVIMKTILKRHGYSDAVASNPHHITRHPRFQQGLVSYATRLEKHRGDVLRAMEKKDLDEEQYRTLADAQSKLTHDHQLLSGGKTENVQLIEDRNVLVAILADIRKVEESEQLHEGHTQL